VSQTTSDFLERLAWYVEETGSDLVDTMSNIASFGAPIDKVLLARGFNNAPSILDCIQLPPPVAKADRFDAYMRVLDHRGMTAHDHATGKYSKFCPNDAMDLNLLQHLADGLIVVTRDYRLIEEVDRSNSAQAPWVRTVGELLAGRFPTGEPFACRARLEKKKHRPRKGENLANLDQRLSQ
jgi:hypothetical protein